MRITVFGDTSISRALSPEFLDSALLRDIGAAPLSIGNLEVALTAQTWFADKVSVDGSAPEKVADYARVGASAWTIATNHAFDWGVAGFLDTLRALDDAGLAHVGGGIDLDAAMRSLPLEDAGERVRVLNFASTLPASSAATPHRPGLAPIRIRQSIEWDAARLEEQPGTPPKVHTWAHPRDLDRAVAAVAGAKEDADVVVVAMHWGVPESFMPASQGLLADYQEPLGHALIDAGADIVIGTHAHCLHPIEFYGKGVILYSLGNFLFHDNPSIPLEDRRPSYPINPVEGASGWRESAIFTVDLHPGTGPVDVRVRPITLDDRGEPHDADEADARRILHRLAGISTSHDPAIVIAGDRFSPSAPIHSTI